MSRFVLSFCVVCLFVEAASACDEMYPSYSRMYRPQPTFQPNYKSNNYKPAKPTIKSVVPDQGELPPQTKVKFYGEVKTVEWVVVKRLSGDLVRAPVINGWMPELSKEKMWCYNHKIPYSASLKRLQAKYGYISYVAPKAQRTHLALLP